MLAVSRELPAESCSDALGQEPLARKSAAAGFSLIARSSMIVARRVLSDDRPNRVSISRGKDNPAQTATGPPIVPGDTMPVAAIFPWTSDDEDAIKTLKIAGALGLIFLLAYSIVDLANRRVGAADAPGAIGHWILLAGTCLFFGITWARSFRRYWRFWTLCYGIFMMAMFVVISARTGDPESRFIAILLCPLAAASFVNWGWRWQLAINIAAVVIFSAAMRLVPISTQFHTYRWLGLLAGLAFAQSTAMFLERYRDRIRGQLENLADAARFRENQMATMAHDIRSPVAALTGYAQLLEEDGVDAAERRQILARIGSTAWSMNLVVSNVLDLYRMQQDGQVTPKKARADLDRIIKEAVDDGAAEARRRGIEFRTVLAPFPRATLDPHHLDRILRNLLGYAISRAPKGPLSLRTAVNGAMLKMEVTAQSMLVSSAELANLLAPKAPDLPARELPLFVARTMAEASGGSLEAFSQRGTGLTLIATMELMMPEKRGDAGGDRGAA